MKLGAWSLPLLCGCLAACQDQHYVSPDVVALVVTDANGADVVNACHYVPVLLGSEIETRYAIDPELNAVLTLTRETVRVSFEGPAANQPFERPSSQFAGEGSETDPAPPNGYTVELRSPCQMQ